MLAACLWIRHWNCSKSEVSATIPPKIKNQIQVVQGDITKLNCDCIVNAANRSLLGGGGIAEAFYGMPQKLRAETLKRLPEDLRAAPFRAGAFLQGESVVY